MTSLGKLKPSTRGPSEKSVEKYFKEQIEFHLGGKAFKFTSPGTRGMPDRIVFLPDGYCLLVELKKPKSATRKAQQMIHKMLNRMGHQVFVVNSKEAVDKFIDFLITSPEEEKTNGDHAVQDVQTEEDVVAVDSGDQV